MFFWLNLEGQLVIVCFIDLSGPAGCFAHVV